VSAVVEESARSNEDAGLAFERIRALAYAAARRKPTALPDGRAGRRFVPKLTEPWFCCAEPNAKQLQQVTRYAGTPRKPDGCDA
jgi:hypothetical protein